MTLAVGSSPCAPHSDCSHWLAPLTGLQCSPTHCQLPAGSNHYQQEVIINSAAYFFAELQQPTGCVRVRTLHPTSPHCLVEPAQRGRPLLALRQSSQPVTCCPSEQEKLELACQAVEEARGEGKASQ